MRIFVFLGVLALVACSTGGAGDDGGTDGGSGAVTLVVDNTTRPPLVGGLSPSSGNAFWQFNITLGNQGVSTPLAAGYNLFTVETDQSLVLQFSTAASLVGTPCSLTTSVAEGGSFTCNLVFEIPTGQTAVTLFYDDTHNHTTSASVPAPPMATKCDQHDAMNFATNSCNTCCGNAIAPQQGDPCATQWIAMNNACKTSADTACRNSCASGVQPSYCGPLCNCISSCSGVEAGCLAAMQAVDACTLSACASSCQ
jgi:hypothetical protein